MAAHTEYLMFNTKKRYDTVHITDEVADIVYESGIREGYCLVSAMHITAGVYVNDPSVLSVSVPSVVVVSSIAVSVSSSAS